MLGLLARIAFCYSVACLQPLSRPIHCQHSCRMPAGIETQLTKGLQVKLILPQIPWKSCTLRTRLGASRLFFTTCHVASWFGRLGPMVRGPGRTHARLQLGVMIKLMLNRYILIHRHSTTAYDVLILHPRSGGKGGMGLLGLPGL